MRQAKGFSGILDRVRLMDLIQVASIGQMSADLEIHSAIGRGLITIRSGQVMNCETGPISGEQALLHVLSWPGGSFEFKSAQTEIGQSIKKSWEQILTESILHRLEGDINLTDADPRFSGHIESIELLELVELACLSKADRVLRLKVEEFDATIVFNEEGICHAEYGEISGETALNEMALAEEGTFESARPQGDEPVTTKRSWDDLLAEARQRRDENRAGPSGRSITSFLQQIQRIKVAEKIHLALTGSREARMILARDSSKIVQLAVLQNPKLSEFEVALMASSRTTDEEVFRKITASREWMRLHQIRAALVNNPKCPIPIASKLIETLGHQEWKRIAANRSVPAVISAAAKRLLSKKM